MGSYLTIIGMLTLVLSPVLVPATIAAITAVAGSTGRTGHPAATPEPVRQSIRPQRRAASRAATA